MRATAARALAFASLLCHLMAQPTGPDAIRHSNWSLQYGIEWRLVRAGMAKLSWELQQEGYGADVHIESAGLVSKLYRVNDDYRTVLSNQLCASSTVILAEEGKRRRETRISYANGKANYLERDLVKNATVLTKETPIPACVYEYFGAMSKLREMNLEPGKSTTVPMSDGKKSANVKVEAQEREDVKTPSGQYKTIRYEVFLFNNVLVNREAHLFLWITDDARRLPVQLRVRMPFLIGTINLQLEKEGKLE